MGLKSVFNCYCESASRHFQQVEGQVRAFSVIVKLQTSRRFVCSSGPRAQSRNSDFQFLYEARVLQHPAAPGTLQHPAGDVCRAAAGEEDTTGNGQW